MYTRLFNRFSRMELEVRSGNFIHFLTLVVALLFIFSLMAYGAGPKPENNGLDRPPSDDEVRYSPDDGDVSATNPPAFIWLPVEGVDEYIVKSSRSDSFDSEETIIVRDIDMSVYIPKKIMEPGEWYWQYGYSEEGENLFSRTRRFEIPETATEFPLVSADELIARIPEHRPRLYFSPELVEEIRADTDGRYSHLADEVITEAEVILAMNEPLFEEPDPWPEEDYRPIYIEAWRTMRPYSQRMVTSALAYLYTGDERFAEEARRRLMHFMTWDVEGASSTIWPTELGMDIAENATPVFDWIYDTPSEDERRKCKEVLTARMVQINRDVHRARPMESRPYSSHPGRMVGFALEGGIVLAHEAAKAYGGRLDRFHRHVLFVRPDYFVIIDDLEASNGSSTYQWLLHTVNEMEVDDENLVVTSSSGDARLTLRFLTPDELDIEQRTGFDPPVENPETAPDQFHLTASTIEPVPSKRFVTVIWVEQDSDLQASGQEEFTNISESSGSRTEFNRADRCTSWTFPRSMKIIEVTSQKQFR